MTEKPTYIDVSDEPLSVQVLYPHENFWRTTKEKENDKRNLIHNRLDSHNEDVVVVHDTDADGLGTAVLIKTVYPNATLIPRHHSEELTITDVGELIAEELDEGDTVFITDNACNDDVESFINPYVSVFEDVYIYDHHEWPDGYETVLDEHEVTYCIDSERCATKIVCDEFLEEPSEEWVEFATVTQDHDLWIKEDSRSDKLANYAYVVDHSVYISSLLEHGLSYLETDDVRRALINQREKEQTQISCALRRTTFHEHEGTHIAIAYGNCPKSDVGNLLCTEYNADVSCIMSPDGGLSFRSSENGLASELANAFNGGGHADAAGGWLKDTVVEGDISYEEYWGSMGHCVRDKIINEFEDIVGEPTDD